MSKIAKQTARFNAEFSSLAGGAAFMEEQISLNLGTQPVARKPEDASAQKVETPHLRHDQI